MPGLSRFFILKNRRERSGCAPAVKGWHLTGCPLEKDVSVLLHEHAHQRGDVGNARLTVLVDIAALVARLVHHQAHKHGDVGNGAGNGGLDCCFFQRELVGFGVLADDDEIGREGFVGIIAVLRHKATTAKRNKAEKREAFAPE